jgi:hypothetical protein
MSRRILSFASAVFILSHGGLAHAACTVPNSLTNGQTADATDVMADFNAVAACADSHAAAGSANSVQINAGSGVLAGVGPLTNGQVLVGSTGAAPQVTTLTAGSGVTITNGPGSITIAASGGGGGGSSLGVTVVKRTGTSSGLPWAWNDVTWQAADYDNLSAWSSGSPINITVPSGVSWMRVTITLTSDSGNTLIAALADVTSSNTIFGNLANYQPAVTSPVVNFNTGWVPITAGHVLKLIANPASSSAPGLTAGCRATFEWASAPN